MDGLAALRTRSDSSLAAEDGGPAAAPLNGAQRAVVGPEINPVPCHIHV